MWTNGEVDNTSDLSFFVGLLVDRMMSGAKRSARIALRKAGLDRLQAYRKTAGILPARRVAIINLA